MALATRCGEIVHQLSVPALLLDPSARILLANPLADRFFGGDAGTAAGRSWAEICDTGGFAPRFRDAVSRAAVQGEALVQRGAGPPGDGANVVVTACPLRDDGEYAGTLVLLGPVPPQPGVGTPPGGAGRQAEPLGALVEDMTELVTRIAPDGTVLFVNDACCRYFGLSREGFMGILAWEQIPDEDRRKVLEMTWQLRPDQPVGSIEHRVIAADGQVRWVHWVNRGFFDEKGQLIEFSGVGRDVTDRRRAEEALRESRDTAWAILNATSDCAALVAADGTITAINEAFARLLGKPVEELIGSNAIDQIPTELRGDRSARLQEALQSGRPVRWEDERAGRHFSNSVYPITTRDGRVTQVAAFAQDITDRRRAEEAQRLAAVGHLAAGVAHEFNNLLGSMMMRADVASRERSDEAYEELVRVVRHGTSRGAEIVGNLLHFAGPHEPRRELVPIEEPLRQALMMAGPAVRNAEIVVHETCATEGKVVLADAGQLEQVFLNLILNACEAMGPGGTLTIEAGLVGEGGQVGEVVVRLLDTGTGIAKEHLPHVFEPFFTTKRASADGGHHATGLGLSVSHGIVAAHGGTITLNSQADVGTTVELRLPAHEAEVKTREPAGARDEQHEPVNLGGRKILVAEDEWSLRAVVSQTLQGCGCEVVTAPAAREATQAIAKQSFDLVICDWLMPGGGGRAVLDCVRALSDPPPVIVVTGWGDQDLDGELASLGVCKCLRKPFDVSRVLAAVQEALA